MLKQIQSSCLGCGVLMIIMGIVGLFSTVMNVGSSNRTSWQLFFGLAKSFGSVPIFSIVTIVLGILLILFIYLLNEYRKTEAEEKAKK